jgi:hypothetical protein
MKIKKKGSMPRAIYRSTAVEEYFQRRRVNAFNVAQCLYGPRGAAHRAGIDYYH